MNTNTKRLGKLSQALRSWFFPAILSSAHLISAFAAGESQSECPPIDRTGLSKLVAQSPDKELKLVFFSGWCSDCALHLKKLNTSSSILVGIFDTQTRIEKIVGKMKLTNPCFTDAGIGKILDVKTVPTERRVTAEMLLNLK